MMEASMGALMLPGGCGIFAAPEAMSAMQDLDDWSTIGSEDLFQ